MTSGAAALTLDRGRRAETVGSRRGTPAALVRRAQAGNTAALKKILRGVAPSMRAAALRILGPNAASRGLDADDVLQEGMVDLVRALMSLRDPSAFDAYAIRIVGRRAIRVRRHARRTQRAPLPPEADEAPPRGRPDRLLTRQRQASALLDLLDELAPRQSEALYLRVALGYTLDEVSAVMGVPPNTVRSRVRLAREAIHKRLDKRPALRELLEIEEDAQ